MRSSGNPVVGGWLDDALRAISPVYSAAQAVRDAAAKKDAAKDAASKAVDSPVKVPPEASATKGAAVPTWVWFALFYLIARKA